MPKGIVGLPAQLRGVYKKFAAKKTAAEPASIVADEGILPVKTK
jgi:hypothetical protein